jgi:2-keto-4-pentenoate hydratase/2-oxohepta-3-ene-1,7-dioic acid hydratase in catechol pathway
MAFPIARLIAELSRGMTLRAGDVLLTGTPAGIGDALGAQGGLIVYAARPLHRSSGQSGRRPPASRHPTGPLLSQPEFPSPTPGGLTVG